MTNELQSAPCLPVRLESALVAIVEDNGDIAGLYAILVKTMDMRICFMARDGAEAVNAFRHGEKKPDILLIDHRMPVMSGLDAMKEILLIDPSARFIFISADEGIRAEAMAAGARAFLRKPISTTEICNTIYRVLEKP